MVVSLQTPREYTWRPGVRGAFPPTAGTQPKFATQGTSTSTEYVLNQEGEQGQNDGKEEKENKEVRLRCTRSPVKGEKKMKRRWMGWKGSKVEDLVVKGEEGKKKGFFCPALSPNRNHGILRCRLVVLIFFWIPM